ncbi:GNAT family N-acetyltransferase [Streptomyces sp. NPDC055817]|uniref:GNAT family N-acetyltransferase n=1 Tax=unclassified Streptomyces TaxID=2593676 RepID=UPI0036C4DD0D
MQHREDHEFKWRPCPSHGDHSRSDGIPGHLDDLHHSPANLARLTFHPYQDTSPPRAVVPSRRNPSPDRADTPRHHPAADHPRHHVIKPATTRKRRRPGDRGQAVAMIEGTLERARQEPRVEFYFAVAKACDEARVIGFARIGLAGVKAGTLGYAIAAGERGHGYARDAARTLTSYAFADSGCTA